MEFFASCSQDIREKLRVKCNSIQRAIDTLSEDVLIKNFIPDIKEMYARDGQSIPWSLMKWRQTIYHPCHEQKFSLAKPLYEFDNESLLALTVGLLLDKSIRDAVKISLLVDVVELTQKEFCRVLEYMVQTDLTNDNLYYLINATRVNGMKCLLAATLIKGELRKWGFENPFELINRRQISVSRYNSVPGVRYSNAEPGPSKQQNNQKAHSLSSSPVDMRNNSVSGSNISPSDSRLSNIIHQAKRPSSSQRLMDRSGRLSQPPLAIQQSHFKRFVQNEDIRLNFYAQPQRLVLYKVEEIVNLGFIDVVVEGAASVVYASPVESNDKWIKLVSLNDLAFADLQLLEEPFLKRENQIGLRVIVRTSCGHCTWSKGTIVRSLNERKEFLILFDSNFCDYVPACDAAGTCVFPLLTQPFIDGKICFETLMSLLPEYRRSAFERTMTDRQILFQRKTNLFRQKIVFQQNGCNFEPTIVRDNNEVICLKFDQKSGAKCGVAGCAHHDIYLSTHISDERIQFAADVFSPPKLNFSPTENTSFRTPSKVPPSSSKAKSAISGVTNNSLRCQASRTPIIEITLDDDATDEPIPIEVSPSKFSINSLIQNEQPSISPNSISSNDHVTSFPNFKRFLSESSNNETPKRMRLIDNKPLHHQPSERSRCSLFRTTSVTPLVSRGPSSFVVNDIVDQPTLIDEDSKANVLDIQDNQLEKAILPPTISSMEENEVPHVAELSFENMRETILTAVYHQLRNEAHLMKSAGFKNFFEANAAALLSSLNDIMRKESNPRVGNHLFEQVDLAKKAIAKFWTEAPSNSSILNCKEMFKSFTKEITAIPTIIAIHQDGCFDLLAKEIHEIALSETANMKIENPASSELPAFRKFAAKILFNLSICEAYDEVRHPRDARSILSTTAESCEDLTVNTHYEDSSRRAESSNVNLDTTITTENRMLSNSFEPEPTNEECCMQSGEEQPEKTHGLVTLLPETTSSQKAKNSQVAEESEVKDELLESPNIAAKPGPYSNSTLGVPPTSLKDMQESPDKRCDVSKLVLENIINSLSPNNIERRGTFSLALQSSSEDHLGSDDESLQSRTTIETSPETDNLLSSQHLEEIADDITTSAKDVQTISFLEPTTSGKKLPSHMEDHTYSKSIYEERDVINGTTVASDVQENKPQNPLDVTQESHSIYSELLSQLHSIPEESQDTTTSADASDGTPLVKETSSSQNIATVPYSQASSSSFITVFSTQMSQPKSLNESDSSNSKKQDSFMEECSFDNSKSLIDVFRCPTSVSESFEDLLYWIDDCDSKSKIITEIKTLTMPLEIPVKFSMNSKDGSFPNSLSDDSFNVLVSIIKDLKSFIISINIQLCLDDIPDNMRTGLLKYLTKLSEDSKKNDIRLPIIDFGEVFCCFSKILATKIAGERQIRDYLFVFNFLNNLQMTVFLRKLLEVADGLLNLSETSIKELDGMRNFLLHMQSRFQTLLTFTSYVKQRKESPLFSSQGVSPFATTRDENQVKDRDSRIPVQKLLSMEEKVYPLCVTIRSIWSFIDQCQYFECVLTSLYYLIDKTSFNSKPFVEVGLGKHAEGLIHQIGFQDFDIIECYKTLEKANPRGSRDTALQDVIEFDYVIISFTDTFQCSFEVNILSDERGIDCRSFTLLEKVYQQQIPLPIQSLLTIFNFLQDNLHDKMLDDSVQTAMKAIKKNLNKYEKEHINPFLLQVDYWDVYSAFCSSNNSKPASKMLAIMQAADSNQTSSVVMLTSSRAESLPTVENMEAESLPPVEIISRPVKEECMDNGTNKQSQLRKEIEVIQIDDDDDEDDFIHSNNLNVSNFLIHHKIDVDKINLENDIIQQIQGKRLSSLSQYCKDVIQERVKRETLGLSVERQLSNSKTGNVAKHESCTPECLGGNDPDPYEEKYKYTSPLFIPCLTGWSRIIVSYYKHSNGQRPNAVIYKTPCGRFLSNMKQVHDYLTTTKSNLMVDFFSFESDVDETTVVRFSTSSILSEDVSNGAEALPIIVLNTVDNAPTPMINYITERTFFSKINEDNMKNCCSGCSCTDDCADPEKCECQLLTKDSFYRVPQVDNEDNFYGYDHRLLKEKTVSGVYECNAFCKCSKSRCLNRVVQLPPRYPMILFKTAIRGWGVRTSTDIPEGAFVMNYIGEIHTDTNLENEVATHAYCANLDYIDTVETEKKEAQSKHAKRSKRTLAIDPIVTAGLMSEPKFVIDGSVKGNLGRYMNHSCNPNVQTQHVFVDTHDLRLPWVSFFAIRNIKAGEELTWDYGYNTNEDGEKEENYCYCASSNCKEQGVLKF